MALTENAKRVTAEEGYEVGYSGKADDQNPYIPGELHNIWKENYDKGIAKRRAEDEGARGFGPRQTSI